MELTINVYDKNGEVVKMAKANTIDLEFGAIRSIMELLNVDDAIDTADLMKLIYSAWDNLVLILNRCFPTMEYNDWDHVKLKELMPVVLNILQYSFSEILTIPKDPKN